MARKRAKPVAAAAATNGRPTAHKVQQLPLEQLRQAEWNANRVSDALMRKIRRSIDEFGFVENLVVRPHPTEKDAYEVLSGNHRLQILGELGLKTAPCVVVEVDDARARLLAQTLNRTRGRDDPIAYRRLINELLESMPADEVSAFLPENRRSLENVLGEIDAPNIEIPEIWGVIVDCENEGDQVELLDKLAGEGRVCRALMA